MTLDFLLLIIVWLVIGLYNYGIGYRHFYDSFGDVLGVRRETLVVLVIFGLLIGPFGTPGMVGIILMFSKNRMYELTNPMFKFDTCEPLDPRFR